jgi:glycosyltransferase involved in cell wall biosynthesis
MRIGIFVAEVGRMAGGPETYEIQLLRALARLDQQNEYFVYCTHAGAVDAIGVRQDNFVYRVLQPASRWISLPVTLPAMLVRDGVRFYHATMVPPPLSPKDYCLSILCFSNWSHPEFYPKAVLRRLNFLLEIGLKKAKYLLCNSENLRNDIHRAFKVPMGRLSVTYLGVGPEFAPIPTEEARDFVRQRYGIEGQYVLFVGKHMERKNVFRVISAYHRFRKETGSAAKLLLIGREPSTTDAIHRQITELGLDEVVTRIRYAPYAELRYLYAGAEMFLFPSLWEGFGLPVIESMACGTPVITSNVTSLPEVAGDGAIVVDPESVDQIVDGMLRLHRDPAFRSALVERGIRQASKFTWDNCARATLESYARMTAE